MEKEAWCLHAVLLHMLQNTSTTTVQSTLITRSKQTLTLGHYRSIMLYKDGQVNNKQT